jgi:creatinine deaminase
MPRIIAPPCPRCVTAARLTRGVATRRRRRAIPRYRFRTSTRAFAMHAPDYRAMLATALAEARQGMAEGGIPIGAALFRRDGTLLGRGRNRRVQEADPSVHGETDAFRKAGRQRSYRDTIMVTTLSPCWYCSGLVRQFGIGTLVMGESVNFQGGHEWLREHGVEVVDLADRECISMLGDWIAANPAVWHEDIGEDDSGHG